QELLFSLLSPFIFSDDCGQYDAAQKENEEKQQHNSGAVRIHCGKQHVFLLSSVELPLKAAKGNSPKDVASKLPAVSERDRGGDCEALHPASNEKFLNVLLGEDDPAPARTDSAARDLPLRARS